MNPENMKPGEVGIQMGSFLGSIRLVDNDKDDRPARLQAIDRKHDGIVNMPLSRMEMECLYEALGKMLNRHGWDGARLTRSAVVNVRDEGGVRREAHLASMKDP